MKKYGVLLVFFSSFLLLPACFKTREDIAREKQEQELQSSLQQSALQSSQQLEKLQAEIGRLQGRLEEVEHDRQKEMSSLHSSVSSEHQGTEKQVADLRKSLDDQQKAQTAAQAALFEEIKRLKEENMELAKSSKAPAAKKGGGAAKNNFAGSFEAYNKKDYDGAAEGFRNFLAANPKGKHTLDARFYLADSLYHKKEYTQAVVEFGAIHEQTPNSAMGRKSTLRIAQSFSALGKAKDAKAFAQILVSTAPDSAEAKKARKYIQ